MVLLSRNDSFCVSCENIVNMLSSGKSNKILLCFCFVQEKEKQKERYLLQERFLGDSLLCVLAENYSSVSRENGVIEQN